ncbi:MAG: ABC transporter permease [Bacteroidota bacterium]
MNKPSPPNQALRFLRWFCREDYLEEIEGNLLELYEHQYEESSAKARRNFVWNVLKHFRPAFIKSFKVYQPNIHRAMLRHNLILTFRSFQRYKSTFFINLIGLSSGLACALLIFLWVQDELSVDKFHSNDAQLYQVMQHRTQNGETITSTWVPGLTAQTMEAEMPEVEQAVTTFGLDEYTLSLGDKDINAMGQFVEEDFFELFSFPLQQGDANQVIADKSSIVISESLAKNLFGTTENVVGKTIELQHEEQYQITGIFADVPRHSSVQFDFVISFKILLDDDGWATRWSTSWPEAYVLLKPDADVGSLNNKVADLINRKTEGEITHRTIFIAPYSKNYLYGNYENGQQAGGRIDYVRLFSIIAVFILLIACINFMNLSTARASRRLKEVGIKKAVGAGHSSLVVQYLGESTLLSGLSLIVAVMLVLLLLPQFNQITGKQIYLEFNLSLILAFLAITVITGVAAGSYPALYLSAFDPAKVLKGALNKSVGELWARKGLVILQFTLSIILITSVFVVYKQIEFVQNKNLGYDKDNILYFNRVSWEEGSLETFLTEIRKIPGVLQASSMGHDMTGHIASTYGVQWPGKDPNDRTEFEMMPVSYEMLELLGVEMKEGRTFSREFSTDTAKIIFNEAAIEHIGFTNPIGEVVERGDEKLEILGIVKNFHFESLHEKVKPMMFWIAPQRTWSVAVKIEGGREQASIEQLTQLHQTLYPGFPFAYKFLDQEYQALYAAEQRVSTLSKYFAGLAILISCLGLFGLAAFTAERRLKEIGIRKALGASAISITRLLTSDFTKMVLIAVTVALPISYFAAQYWLQNFAFSISLQWWYFAGAGLVALLIAWLTVGLQTVKAARINPVECLRDE